MLGSQQQYANQLIGEIFIGNVLTPTALYDPGSTLASHAQDHVRAKNTGLVVWQILMHKDVYACIVQRIGA